MSADGSGLVTVRYWAAARDAAGTVEEGLSAAAVPTLADLLRLAGERHGPRLASVLERCSFVVDEHPVAGRDPSGVRLAGGAVVEVLPPFAGGAGGPGRPRPA